MKKTATTRLFFACLVALFSLAAMAVPAKPGVWAWLKLADGTEVKAQLKGDEHLHFWMTEDGQRLVKDGDTYAYIDEAQLLSRAKSRRAKTAASMSRGTERTVKPSQAHYTGKKKGLVILVEFTDVHFQKGNNWQKFNNILNATGYNEGKFRGSVADYFKEQSNGQFELTFDLAGPYTLAHDMAYYGENNDDGEDKRPIEMVMEACRAANAEVNFANYDWDGDGEVDEVFVLYAGKGEADGGGEDTIWPHMWQLSGDFKTLMLDGVRIDIYACSNEITPYKSLNGIGTFCHEFSHCLGFPDFYDINYTGEFGMGDLDLMGGGSYNGNGFCPPNYTAHERMWCGWLEPIVLGSNNMSVRGMKSMSNYGNTYIIYNEAYPNEYYTLENRQKTGWDTNCPARGLMITHVDYNEDVWMNNIPNSILTQSEALEMGLTTGNDHQRMAIVHADNEDDKKYWTGSWYTKSTTTSDLYPYLTNDSLTATSYPAATLFHTNLEGTKFLRGAILNITQNSDGTIDFDYRAKGGSLPDEHTEGDGVLFYESFDKCDGTGGNDGRWNGTVAKSIFKPDNEGWDALYSRGANHCARFGTENIVGKVTTPSFTLDGEAALTFRAAPWVNTSDGTDLQLTANGAFGSPTISPAGVSMKRGEWTSYEVTISGQGEVSITFVPDQRFFLDEVKVVKKNASAIKTVKTSQKPAAIYSLTGRYMGTSAETLRPGLYVSNGKKIIIR